MPGLLSLSEREAGRAPSLHAHISQRTRPSRKHARARNGQEAQLAFNKICVGKEKDF